MAGPPPPNSNVPAELGGWRLVERLGRGGMGEVWRGEREIGGGIKRRAAIKRILPDMQADPVVRERFLAEARITARLEHPNIVSVIDFGDSPEPFLVFEYVEGINAGDVLREAAQGSFRPPVVVSLFIVAEAAVGLDYAHRKKDDQNRPLRIVHRDVSPHNVLISVDGAVKLSDFGVASAADNTLRTRTGLTVGKVSYMAPEQAAGEHIDARADVFSLGVTLWELLTIRPLLPRSSPAAALRALQECNFPPPSQVNTQLPPAVDELVMRALQRNPDQRYTSAGAMAQALRGFIHSVAPGFDAQQLIRILGRLMPSVQFHMPSTSVLQAASSLAPGLHPPSAPAPAPSAPAPIAAPKAPAAPPASASPGAVPTVLGFQAMQMPAVPMPAPLSPSPSATASPPPSAAYAPPPSAVSGGRPPVQPTANASGAYPPSAGPAPGGVYPSGAPASPAFPDVPTSGPAVPMRRSMMPIVLGVLVGLTALGAGGYALVMRHEGATPPAPPPPVVAPPPTPPVLPPPMPPAVPAPPPAVVNASPDAGPADAASTPQAPAPPDPSNPEDAGARHAGADAAAPRPRGPVQQAQAQLRGVQGLLRACLELPPRSGRAVQLQVHYNGDRGVDWVNTQVDGVPMDPSDERQRCLKGTVRDAVRLPSVQEELLIPFGFRA